jgi:autotransporter passenger strand-loop-strand repeat protein
MDPNVYAFEALGVALATGQHFQNEFGPSNPAYPVSTIGDIHFVDDAYTSVFGHAGTPAQVQHFADQLSFFEGLYTAAGTFGSQSNIDLLARGAVYGQMLGIEQESTPVGNPTGGTTFTAPPNQSDLVLNSGDILNVNSGGRASHTTINAGGIENVNGGGIAVSTEIGPHGILNINSGGEASRTHIESEGILNVNVGGSATGTALLPHSVEKVFGEELGPLLTGDAIEIVEHGGFTSGVIFTGGTLVLADPDGLSHVESNVVANGTVRIDFEHIIVLPTLTSTDDNLDLLLSVKGYAPYHFSVLSGGNPVQIGPVQIASDGAGGTLVSFDVEINPIITSPETASIVGTAPIEMHSA